MTKRKEYEILQDLMDLVIEGTIALMVFGMMFNGLFNWITIGIVTALMFIKVFLDNEITCWIAELENKEES